MLRRALPLVLVIALLPAAPARAEDGCPFPETVVFPGDSVTKTCVVENGSSVDGGFTWYIDQSTITVFDEHGNVVTGSDRDTYIGFHEISFETQRVLTADNPAGPERDDVDLAELPEYRTTCDERPLTELDGSDFGSSRCAIGRVRRADYPYSSPLRTFHTREYRVTLHFVDRGNQTAYAGWGITFEEVVTGMVPPRPDCPGGCAPVYER